MISSLEKNILINPIRQIPVSPEKNVSTSTQLRDLPADDYPNVVNTTGHPNFESAEARRKGRCFSRVRRGC